MRGRPDDGSKKVPVVGEDGARLEETTDLIDVGPKGTAKALIKRYGPKIVISAIGPGGRHHSCGQ